MREGDWQELVQYPQRPMTYGQWQLVTALNLAALSAERLAALALRLIIEGRRLHSQRSVTPRNHSAEKTWFPVVGERVIRLHDGAHGTVHAIYPRDVEDDCEVLLDDGTYTCSNHRHFAPRNHSAEKTL